MNPFKAIGKALKVTGKAAVVVAKAPAVVAQKGIRGTMSAVMMGLIRHALTAVGGALLVKPDLLSDDELGAGVAAVMVLVGIVGSVVNKRKAQPDPA